MKSINILAALFCIILLAACSKKSDNSDNNNMSAIVQKLTAGKWQISGKKATVSYMGKDTTIDYYSQLDPCEKDDIIIFTPDESVTRDDHTNKCAGRNQTAVFAWKLLDNETKIAIYDSNPDTLDLKVTDTQLQFSQTKMNTSGYPILQVETYTKVQ